MLSKLSVIAGKSSEDIAKKLSRKVKANFVKSQVRVFEDGESKITLSGKISKRKSIVVQSIYPPVDTNLIQALSLISKAKETSSEELPAITDSLLNKKCELMGFLSFEKIIHLRHYRDQYPLYRIYQ